MTAVYPNGDINWLVQSFDLIRLSAWSSAYSISDIILGSWYLLDNSWQWHACLELEGRIYWERHETTKSATLVFLFLKYSPKKQFYNISILFKWYFVVVLQSRTFIGLQLRIELNIHATGRKHIVRLLNAESFWNLEAYVHIYMHFPIVVDLSLSRRTETVTFPSSLSEFS